jgi:hypothetical protein
MLYSDSSVQECLRYSTHGFWFAHIGNTYMQVPGAIYEKLLAAYLISHGATTKTYTQIFSEAENEWSKRVQLEMQFRSDMKMWLLSDIPGVYIRIEK